MAPDRRLERLRDLLARLERLPASAQREWMLQEVRARLVDVETGAEPYPMRALHEEPVATPVTGTRPVPRSRPKRARAAASPRLLPEDSTPELPPSPPAASRVDGPDPTVAMLGDDEVLWLNDGPEPAESDPADGSTGVAPWRRGLRG